MIAIIALLLANDDYPRWIWDIGFYALHFAALLSVYSMLLYFKNAWGFLKEK